MTTEINGSAETLIISLRNLVQSALSVADASRAQELRKKRDGHEQAIESLTRAGVAVPDVLREALSELRADVEQSEEATRVLIGLQASLSELLTDINKVTAPAGRRRRGRGADGEAARPRSQGVQPRGFIFCGTEYRARTWVEVLRELLRNLRERHEAEFDRILILRRRTVRFSRDRSQLGPAELIPGTDIYVDLRLNAGQVADICQELAKLFGYSASDFEILEAD